MVDIINPQLWYIFFLLILLAYLLVIWKAKNKKKFLIFFLVGSIFGFYFDLVSVTQDYYSYHQYFSSIYRVPLTVTIAEGGAVGIIIYLFEYLKSLLGKYI